MTELYFIKSTEKEYLEDKKVLRELKKNKIGTKKDFFRTINAFHSCIGQIYTYQELCDQIEVFISFVSIENETEAQRKKLLYSIKIFTKILLKCHFEDYIYIGYGKVSN